MFPDNCHPSFKNYVIKVVKIIAFWQCKKKQSNESQNLIEIYLKSGVMILQDEYIQAHACMAGNEQLHSTDIAHIQLQSKKIYERKVVFTTFIFLAVECSGLM